MNDPTDELSVIERYYDTVPRVSATTEEIGPFTLFVATPDTSWQFYARPRLGLGVAVTADDVRRVMARQDELGVPRAIEWVHETTPSLLDAVREAVPDAEVEVVPLMVSRRDEAEPREVPGRREVLTGSSADLAAVVGAVDASFNGRDEFEPGAVGVRPRLLDEGTLVMVAAYDGSGRLVGGGSAAPRGAVAELMGLATLPSARGHGHGTALTTAIRSEVRRRGADVVFLTAASDDATSIYRAVGFERAATGCILGPPMTERADTVVRMLHPDEWRTWREIRLRSLADSPEAFGSTLAREQAFTETDWRQRLDRGGVSVLATVGGVPAALGGGFRVRDGWMQVVAMWTDPAYRRRGLAVRVLDVVVAAARAEGRRLVLDVAQGNSAARTAYERYGFVPTGESEPIRSGTAARADLMVLPEA